MKKIGLLFGQENGFPQAFIDRVNEKKIDDITAEAVSIDKAIQGTPSGYAVLLDRISQDVPFYRAWLKQAALEGTAVINNPFWWSADDKFVDNELAQRTGVQVPKTALIPSRELPLNTSDQSFRNLVYPFDWDAIFDHVGFPAYMKPFNGGGWKHVYKIHDREEFFAQHARTGQLVMMLQEEIKYEAYYRCYCIGGRYVRVIPYDPYQPENQRYLAEDNGDSSLLNTIADQVARLNQYLGYDFNSVEIAVRNNVPYLIDCWNPAPETNEKVIGAEHFEWVVETAATYAIQRAQQQIPGTDNLTWGNFLQHAINGQQTVIVPGAKKAVAKKPAAMTAAKLSKDGKDLKEAVLEKETPAKKTPAKKTKKKE
ncbi:ATP-grasp domain-containing protein [Chitinophaga ginsengisoli]|uniref:Glutathione synthase/RimK-type ligase-like ATP-grasp enzyme n=1 Tax=Chitinophaga ginsengisoli TaxID=363837 RepID=A0A2P8FW57_9BACT|nr:hypothetical protein [Chitinophaga ginsengisoli]PSL25944.1 glutathione synthase/RimK-type ligase-like ATP-grasp enzyme [Chitinophaga ginsengisoli]